MKLHNVSLEGEITVAQGSQHLEDDPLSPVPINPAYVDELFTLHFAHLHRYAEVRVKQLTAQAGREDGHLLEDCVQGALLAVWLQRSKFNPHLATFPTFGKSLLTWAVLDQYWEHKAVIRIPTGARKQVRTVYKRLKKHLHRNPSTEEVVQAIVSAPHGSSAMKDVDWQIVADTMSRPVLSLDASLSGEPHSESTVSALPDSGPTPEEEAERCERLEKLVWAMDQLPGDEKDLIKAHYGIGKAQGLSLRNLAVQKQSSRSEVHRQILRIQEQLQTLMGRCA
jgi:RNA polymerase sigma factor (sigma-70 family)